MSINIRASACPDPGAWTAEAGPVTRLMVAKTTWDYAYYWSVLTWLYFRKVITDIDFLREIQPRLIAMRELNMTMQAAFRHRAAERRQDAGRGRFFDQAAIPVLYDLNAATGSCGLLGDLRQRFN